MAKHVTDYALCAMAMCGSLFTSSPARSNEASGCASKLESLFHKLECLKRSGFHCLFLLFFVSDCQACGAAVEAPPACECISVGIYGYAYLYIYIYTARSGRIDCPCSQV